MPRSTLYIGQVLKWADAHRRRTGDWPTNKSGYVHEAPDEKWTNIDQALRKGLRGLRPGSSLARLLAQHRGKRNRKQLPRYTIRQILGWADEYHGRTGRWPTSDSGGIREAPGETWMAIEVALRNGQRGLRGGSSLAQLLARKRKVRNRSRTPPLSVRQILAWCDAHHRQTGLWPRAEDGPIHGQSGETWQAVDVALKHRGRGLRIRSSLFNVLQKHRGITRHVRRPPLTVAQILKWADAHHARTGRWPTVRCGEIPESGSETWLNIHEALRQGRRGLPRTTLAEMLVKHRGIRRKGYLPRFSKSEILRWARAYRRRHGRWPNRDSGPIDAAPGETWAAVDSALKAGARGLLVNSTLSRVLATFS